MDWNDLRNQVSNISLYDIKAGVRKVQNAVMNYTETESKVREATNNEPWGASSSLMQEIANATFNYQLLNEIMPMIYKRFTEKSAEEWRQIYKSLQLLEFLIKNGSERVIDDARSHLSLLKMLRQFQYIDQNGKDQGVNVRNRSKELAELLGDVERIRAERKKAKGTRAKYGGVEGGAGLGGSSSTADRYGGFGSETGAGYGGSTRGVYGDGGGFGGESHDDYEDPGRRGGAERFDEYDEFDDGGAHATPGRRRGDTPGKARATPKKAAAPPPKPKEPEVDLFDFGDEPATTSAPIIAPALSAPSLLAPAPAAPAEDDDFDDFQSATPSISTSALPPPAPPKPNYSSFAMPAPTPAPAAQPAAFTNLLSSNGSAKPSSFSSASSTPAPSGYNPTGPNYYTSVPAPSTSSTTTTISAFSSSGSSTPLGGTASKPAAKAGGGDVFANLLSGTALKKDGKQGSGKGMTIADMAKAKSQAGLYGANAAAPTAPAAPMNGNGNGMKKGTGSSGLDDLLG